MKRAWTGAILGLWLMAAGGKAQAAEVTFRVIPETLPEPQQVFITGDHDALGNWDLKAVPLERGEDGSWSITLSFEPGTALEYKITRGSWLQEALDAEGNIPENFDLKVTGDTTVAIPVPRWKDEGLAVDGQVTGTVETHRNMEGEGILPRDVLVWLPPSYETEPGRYPVLYMHDGQQVFDPTTSTWGKDWQVDEVATRLIEEGKMREIIVVASTCTENRGPEYSTEPEGKAFREFTVKKLKPFIDEIYRTLPDRENTAIMGSSMGGFSSFLFVWEYPEVFSMAGCLSPAFWNPILQEVDAYDGPPKDVRIYMDNGGVGLEKRLQVGTDWMLELLPKKGFTLGENLVWVMAPEAEHNEAAWAERVWMPLLYFFGTGANEWIADLPPPPEPLFAEKDKEPKPVESRPACTLAGVSVEWNWRDNEKNLQTAWNKLEELLPELDGLSDQASPEFIGMRIPVSEEEVRYFIGQVVPDEAQIPDSLEKQIVPAGEYARISHHGSIPELSETRQYIFNWWLPRTHLQLPEGMAVLEQYQNLPGPEDDSLDLTLLVPTEPLNSTP